MMKDFRDRVTKECVYTVYHNTFNKMVREAFGIEDYDITAEEEHLYEASLKKSASKLSDKALGKTREIIASNKYPTTGDYLDVLATEGYIEPGTYMIEYYG